MRLPRGIFVKLVTIFLIIGLIPFLGLSFWTYHKAEDRMTETVITYWLVRQARETAAQLDREMHGIRTLIRSRADDNILAEQMTKLGTWGVQSQLEEFLRRQKNYSEDLDLLVLIDAAARTVVAESTAGEQHLKGMRLEDLPLPDTERQWIENALSPDPALLDAPEVPVSIHDWHVSGLNALSRGEAATIEGYPDRADRYAVGVAGTIVSPESNKPVGVLVGIFNWARIQGVLDRVTDRFQARDDPRFDGVRYASGYPFLFYSNRDTIIAHKNQAILGESLVRDHGLKTLHDRIGLAPYGAHEYEYPPGTRKISGYAYTDGAEHGFSWVVGVGINDDEIYADVELLRDFMFIAALIVAGMVVLLAAVFSHRLTEPITRLIGYTAEVARGNLGARVEIKTRDEIAVLADSFNKMAEDLGESNRRLIKAEKNAAWQEMARQVAHEIKNPLTPIMLSAQQLKRAHDDQHPAFDEIMDDSVRVIVEQCEGLRRIASDFASFARFPDRKLEPIEVGRLISDNVDLYRPRAASDIEVSADIRTPEGTLVMVDKGELGRVFLNLFNNAIQAMEGGGALTVVARLKPGTDPAMVDILVSDTGRGIPPEDQHRLFEPYFSTRTGGTGLGLAICQRIIHEYGGQISVVSEPGQGTTFTITLPQAAQAPKEP